MTTWRITLFPHSWHHHADPYPYEDYLTTLRTPETRELLHTMEQEAIVLLENRNNVLPLSKSIGSIALIGPQVDRVSVRPFEFRLVTLTHFTLSQFGDYVFFNATNNGISPLAGFTQHLGNTSVQIKYAEGCKLWSNDPSGIPAAVEAAKSADAAIVLVGTWSLDQTLLWTPGTNATTGEHVDVSDLGLVGAQLQLVQAVKDAAQGKPTIVVLVSGKPVAEPWIQARELPFRSSSILSPCAYCVLSLLLFDPLAWMDTCTDDRCRCCRTAVLSWRTRWSRTR